MTLPFIARTASALAVVAALVGGPALGAPQSPSPAPSTLPTTIGEIDAEEGATASSQVAVPEGITPAAFTATLRLDDPSATAVIYLGNVAVFTANGQPSFRVSVPIPSGTVSRGILPISLRYRSGTSNEVCRTVDAEARLSAITVEYTGVETVPSSLATFFPLFAPQVDVAVDPHGSDDLLQAALVAVGAVSHRYPQPTHVTFNAPVGHLPGTRQIAIRPGPNPVTATMSVSDGVPTLTLAGSGDPLSRAAAYLGAQNPIRLLDSAQGTAPAASTGPGSVALHQTLQRAAGTDQLVLSGYGSSQAYVGIRQDTFGGPIDILRLHLPFTNTAIPPGSTAQLDVLFNDHLLWSRDLGADDGYSGAADVTVNANDLQRDNGLVIRLSATAAQGHCLSGPLALPLEVHLATADATMTAESGLGSLAGFQRFPQVLAGTLPVAIRANETDRPAAESAAAAIVTALQQVASTQLQIRLVDPGTFVASHDTGVLVGATAADTDAVQAPLRLVPNRLLGNANVQYQVINDQPYAAMEAVARPDRDVLLVGSWSPDSTTSDSRLTSRIADQVASGGWAALNEDVLVTTLHQRPFTIASGAFVPSAAQLAEHGHAAYWLLLGVLVVAILVGVNYLLVHRRRRVIRDIVDAQQRADATEAD